MGNEKVANISPLWNILFFTFSLLRLQSPFGSRIIFFGNLCFRMVVFIPFPLHLCTRFHHQHHHYLSFVSPVCLVYRIFHVPCQLILLPCLLWDPLSLFTETPGSFSLLFKYLHSFLPLLLRHRSSAIFFVWLRFSVFYFHFFYFHVLFF